MENFVFIDSNEGVNNSKEKSQVSAWLFVFYNLNF